MDIEINFDEVAKEAVELRCRLHKIPELGYKEFKTARLIADYLRKIGIEATENVAKTGVVGLLRGSLAGKTLLLRADMDALPIGHCCGHDVHMAILLGVAKCFSASEFTGNVKFVFQPAEEEFGGAEPMIEAGVMENPYVDGAAAFHIAHLPAGTVGLKKGSVTASPDFFTVRVIGKGGHGAKPEECVNPLSIVAQITSKIHALNTDASFVVTVCTIEGGTSENIIPEACVLKGTARAVDMATRDALYKAIRAICESAASDFGGKTELDYRFRYPPIVNDDAMVDCFAAAATRIIGSENVIWYDIPDMTGDDFAYFAKCVPSVYVKLGGALTPLHAPDFDIDERCIRMGIEIMYNFAINFLKDNDKN